MIVYFETSAINAFAKKHSIADAVATKAFQQTRGRKWCLSSVVIWEILLTADDYHKEEILFLCQHLFHEDLLPSPEELIVEFINQGCPVVEKPRELISKTALSDVWRDICADKRRTFVYDKQDLKNKVNHLISLSKLVRQIIKGHDVVLPLDNKTVGTDLTLENLLKGLPYIRQTKHVSAEDRLMCKLALLYIMFFLCACVSFNNEITKVFWNKIGIEETVDRIFYILGKYEVLVYQGPFVEMAIMTLNQSKRRFSRGILFDSLHTLYLPYVDFFITNDDHFALMRKEIQHHPNASKIFKMNEVKWIYHPRDVIINKDHSTN